MELRGIIREIIAETFKGQTITVFHGTSQKKAKGIETSGLNGGSMGYSNAGWYMVSTDFASALFHATAEEGEDAIVFEFKVPVDNNRWEGNPYFWPPYNRTEDSKWFALRKPLESSLIKDIHHVSYDDFLLQKNKRF